MARGQSLSDETKAQVLAALAAGGGVGEVSRQTGVPKGTVSRLKNELAPQVLAQSISEQSAVVAPQLEQSRASVGTVGTVGTPPLYTLVAELLNENLMTLATHARMARAPEWFTKQDAHGIAAYDGGLADKTIRILEAAAAAQSLENISA